MYRLIAFLVVLGVIYWMVKRAFFPPRAVLPAGEGQKKRWFGTRSVAAIFPRVNL